MREHAAKLRFGTTSKTTSHVSPAFVKSVFR